MSYDAGTNETPPYQTRTYDVRTYDNKTHLISRNQTPRYLTKRSRALPNLNARHDT